LADMPKSGCKKVQWTENKNIRFWNIKKYMIVYEINKDSIIIVRVLSSFRDIASLLK
jgi:plasmid stabilization system protein ParE